MWVFRNRRLSDQPSSKRPLDAPRDPVRRSQIIPWDQLYAGSLRLHAVILYARMCHFVWKYLPGPLQGYVYVLNQFTLPPRI